MKTFLKIFFTLLLAGFIILQFFQPDKNVGEQLTETDLVWSTGIPVEMAEKIMTSCYDCHSNYTHYPWYGNVSPVSLLLDKHIREGKEKLNFSVWTEYSKKEKVILLGGICSELLDMKMPLSMYVQLHKKAKVSTDDIFLICDWTDQETEGIISKD
jgi:hypothetical protein